MFELDVEIQYHREKLLKEAEQARLVKQARYGQGNTLYYTLFSWLARKLSTYGRALGNRYQNAIQKHQSDWEPHHNI